MTRKDYVKLAAALNRARPASHPEIRVLTGSGSFPQWCRDVQALADVLAADNPRFDVDRFWDAADR